jgi:photosystem II stability/assembly factor-like uncharacterized protein
MTGQGNRICNLATMTTKLYLGTRKGLIEAERTAQGWQLTRTSFLGVQVPMLLPDRRDGRLYAAVDHGHFGGKLHVSSDQGATWEECACPAYPPKPEEVPDVVCAMSQRPIPWTLEKIWSLEAGGADQPGVLWCGTIPGGLFKSTDSGASWTLVESLWYHPKRAKWFGGGYDWPGIHSICVDPRNSRHLVLGISCGGVWETTDGGQTWNCIGEGLEADFMPPDQAADPDIQDPHLIAMCAEDPDVIWMQHHNGIFRSADSGHHWERHRHATPSDFGFAVAVHPRDGQTAWFVPGVKDDQRVPPDGALCVMRTRDGGRTYEACRTGLPQEHAYHLVYRHGLDVSGDGQILAMGTTTGSVWISEDAGDVWTRLSADLPPVYCVRFQ